MEDFMDRRKASLQETIMLAKYKFSGTLLKNGLCLANTEFIYTEIHSHHDKREGQVLLFLKCSNEGYFVKDRKSLITINVVSVAYSCSTSASSAGSGSAGVTTVGAASPLPSSPATLSSPGLSAVSLPSASPS